MAMFDSPNMLCSLSSRSIVDRYLSDSLLYCELVVDDEGDRDGELKKNNYYQSFFAQLSKLVSIFFVIIFFVSYRYNGGSLRLSITLAPVNAFIFL